MARVAREHAQGLTRRFETTLVSDRLPGNLNGVAGRKVALADFRWMRRFGHVVRAMALSRALAREVQSMDGERRVDFIWCHAHGDAWEMARRGFSGRVGLTVHGDIFDRPRGTYDPLLSAWYRFVAPRAYERCNPIHVFSEAGKSRAIEHGAGKDQVFVLPNGVDCHDLAPGPGIPEPGRILFVGRISVEKGLGDLLEAMRSPALQHATLDIVGDGPERHSCEEFAKKYRLKARFHGLVERSGLAGFYQRASVFCSPSLDEPFSTSILEAMSFGCPVVGTRVGGTPFIVEEGVTGLTVEPRNPDRLAAGLHNLLSNPALASSLGAAGQHRVRNQFAWPAICERLGDRIARQIDSIA